VRGVYVSALARLTESKKDTLPELTGLVIISRVNGVVETPTFLRDYGLWLRRYSNLAIAVETSSSFGWASRP